MSEEKDLINADAAVVSSEDYDAEMAAVDPGEPAPKKRKRLKKWQIITIAVASVVLLLLIILLSIFGPFLWGKADVIPFTTSEIKGFSRYKTYVGTNTYNADGTSTVKEISLQALFPGELYENATFTIKKGNAATIEGNMLKTTDTTGEMILTATVEGREDNFAVEIINGISVFNFAQLEKVVSEKKNVILQSNIKIPALESWTTALKEVETLEMYANLYGNAYKIDATDFTTDTNASMVDSEKQYKEEFSASETVIDAKGPNINIINVHMIGKRVRLIGKEEKFALNDFADGGTLIAFDLDDEKPNEAIGGSVKYCVLEKSHMNVSVDAATVTIESNLMRETADANISISTSAIKSPVVNIKNNVLINPQIAGIVLYNLDGSKTTKFATVNIEGVFDVYNWKNQDTAALMPVTEETFYNPVNKAIQNGLNSNAYDHMVVKENGKDENGKDKLFKWVHIGIIVISTGSGPNKPVINGDHGFTKRELPFPTILDGILGLILKSRDMYGYLDGKTMAPANPGKIEINEQMFAKIGFPSAAAEK